RDAHLGPKQKGSVKKDWKYGYSHQRQFPAHAEHKVENKDDTKHISHHIHYAVAEQIAERFNIACGTRNEPANRIFIKKLHVQRLDLLENGITHIIQHSLTEPASQIGVNDQQNKLTYQSSDQQ